MALTPFLMFTGLAEDAVRFYAATFPGAEVLGIEHWGEGEGGLAGTVRNAVVRIAGQELRCIDSPPLHAFGFTPSISFFYDCDDEATLDRLCASLSDRGEVLMPPGEYPFAKRFAWVNDRFGVSWQLSVARDQLT